MHLAFTRRPTSADRTDSRVIPLLLDITDPAQIRDATLRSATLDVLVNNAGLALADDLTDRERARAASRGEPVRAARHDPGVLAAAHPLARSRGQRAVVRLARIVADHPGVLGLQGRGVLADPGHPGAAGRRTTSGCTPSSPVRSTPRCPVSSTIPKADPADVARAIFDGVAARRRRSSRTRCPPPSRPAGPRGRSSRSNSTTPRCCVRPAEPGAHDDQRPDHHLHHTGRP